MCVNMLCVSVFECVVCVSVCACVWVCLCVYVCMCVSVYMCECVCSYNRVYIRYLKRTNLNDNCALLRQYAPSIVNLGFLTLEDVPKLRKEITTTRCVTAQKSAVLSYFATEA